MTVMNKIAEMYPDVDVFHTSLDEAGVDSFGMVAIILEMEQTFDFIFEDEIDPHEFQTFNQFATYLEEKISHGSC